MRSTNNKGFTLLEVLLVVGILSILAGIVILAINPNKNLIDSRNATRRTDVNTILNAVYQYAIDNNGTIPSTILLADTEVCSTTGLACSGAGFIDLGVLTTNGRYLVAIPSDPTGFSSPDSGYNIQRDANNRVTVSAPSAEGGATISVTR